MKQHNDTPTAEQLTEFAQHNSWERGMSSGGLDNFSNYGGPNLGALVVVVGRNRDSEVLSESNFEAALEMLGGESDSVTVERFDHWGCGWFELILVDPTDRAALLKAYEIKRLLDEYPVLDEDDFFESEREQFSEFAEDTKADLAEAIVLHLGLPEELADDAEMLEVAYQLQMERQYSSGGDGSIDLYTMREPEERDVERFIDALEACCHNGRELTDALEYLLACFNLLDEGA